MNLHIDSVDVAALLCLRHAKRTGLHGRTGFEDYDSLAGQPSFAKASEGILLREKRSANPA